MYSEHFLKQLFETTVFNRQNKNGKRVDNYKLQKRHYAYF